jgi:putative tryptophan/tyrosine transport system substrate-binding protein
VSFLVQELTAKRLELLHEIVPAATSIGLLVNPTGPQAAIDMREAQAAARVLSLRLSVQNASTPEEIEAAFAGFVEQRVGALLVGGEPLFFNQRDQLAALAAGHRVPAIYALREHVDAGGLMSYGASSLDASRIAGNYTGRILKGDKPADLPVQRSTRIEMVLNLKAAKALGIDPVPTATLLRANEVIE